MSHLQSHILIRILPPSLLIAALLITWQTLVWLTPPDAVRLIASPLEVAERLVMDAGLLLQRHIPITLLEAVIGLVLALLLGVLTAAALDLLPALRRAVYPVLVISQTIPIIAFAPLLILVFGFGIEPKIAVVVLFCFFPITVATLDGLQGTPSEVLSLMRSFGATRAQTWIKARFISALPSLFSGLRISATYAVTGALFGEWVTAQAGLGPYLLTGYRQGRSEQVFAAIFVVAVLSVILVVLVGVIERRLLAWHFHASGTWEDLSA
jgi:ABC-type nitrate/sulfonate/bicarbonate transport system permease component